MLSTTRFKSKTMKAGFHPHQDKTKYVVYAKYHLIPGVWIYSDDRSPKLCWGVFTPENKLIKCKVKFLDAKEVVKDEKIRKYRK